ncbi:MAG: phosphoribosylanthranilate isomerase [Candidatus Omnitrophica bacterium]|nr:phosphoribosylanthranilate isomerase [Candidatus Omnitrophota bacterium]
MKPKVKICGITNIEDALNAVWSGADILGFVFYKKSKRYIKPQKAREIIDILPLFVLTAGLFVNESITKIKKIARYCKFDFLQLHGDEKVGYLNKLKDFRLIKAIRVKDKTSLKSLDNLSCDLILFDNYSDSLFGGTGRNFDWSLAKEIKKLKKPYIISGGLTPLNVKKAINLFSPYAVDVSTGVEKKPGKKDKTLIKEFIKNAKTK